MSLINDALKRAGRRSPDAGGGGGGGGAPMTPVELSPRPKSNFALLALLVACVLAGGYCYLQWKRSKTKGAQTTAAPSKPATNAPSSTAMPKNGLLGAAQLIRHTTNLVAQIKTRQESDTSVSQAVNPTNAAGAPKTNPPVVAEAVSAPPPAEPVPPANPAPAPSGPFPAVKLQGIFYRLNNPTVLIDGDTFKTGDTLVGGVKLARINRMDIEVEWRGQRKTVRLPDAP